MKKTALHIALAAVLAPAWGQDPDPEIAALTRLESEISVGLGYWTEDRPRLGTYDGMRESGAYGLLDGRITTRDERTGTWFLLDARNLGLETRGLRAEWLRQGNLGLFLEYDRTPRDEPYTVFTAAQGIGTVTQRVPAFVGAGLGGLELGTVREAFGGGASKILGGGYDFRVNFKSEDKTGDRLWGRGGAPEFAAEPINSTTRQLEAVLAYTGKQLQVQGGYYGSWYTNRNEMLTTARFDAAGATVAGSPFFLSLPLDNEAHQWFAGGGYNFGERTRGTFKLAHTKATQNEQIPVGAGLILAPSAPASLDGRIDTTLMQVGVTSRTTDALSWLASLRSYESDEKTPQRRIVETDPACPTTSSCVDNTPLDFRTVSAKLEATYRLTRELSMTGGLEQIDQQREVPVGTLTPAGDIQRWVPWRADVEETIWRVELRRSLAERLNGRIAYLHSARDGSEYTVAAAGTPPDDPPLNNLINPIHVADRDRDKVRLMLDWAPLEALTLTFNVEHAKDEYGHTEARPFGLREGTARVYSIDASYALSERWQLSAWYTRDETAATQLGQRAPSGGASQAVKEAQLEDVGDTFGAGVRATLTSGLRAGLDFLHSKNVNRYPETVTPVAGGVPGTLFPSTALATAVGPLPDITNKLTRLNLFAIYALDKNTDVRLDFIHERWQTDDWSWMFAGGTPFTYGETTDGTQVVQSRKQNAEFVGVRYSYRFP
jgi:MtrB/PioB family decaheme-associated outer membrane protein